MLKFNYLAVLLVPRAGVEPARIAPLVFETSASTDSLPGMVPRMNRCYHRKFLNYNYYIQHKQLNDTATGGLSPQYWYWIPVR